MKFRTIKFKFGVLYVLLLSVILTAFSSFLFFSARYVLYRNLDHELLEKSRELTEMINLYLSQSAAGGDSIIVASRKVIRLEGVPRTHTMRNETEERLLRIVDKYNLEKDVVNLADSHGVTIVRSRDSNLGALDRFLKSRNASLYRAQIPGPEYKTFQQSRMIFLPVKFRDGKQYILQIATSTNAIDHLLREWAIFIIFAIPAMALLTSFLSRLFVNQILKPVQEISRTAEKISHEDLSLRVEARDADEEMQGLANSLNEMIQRLETSFGHIQEFSSHAAHELKTPLAIIRGESEIALRKDRDAEEYRRILAINLREFERMVKVIEDMLLMSRLEYETQIYEFHDMDLKDFLKEIHGQSEILALKKEIRVELHCPESNFKLKADALHLRRLFFNLLDNAIKFSPKGGEIQIRLKKEKNSAQVSISDQGPGISAQNLTKVFNKFFHQNTSGADLPPGNGLGLSIARSIAIAHQGEIKVESTLGNGSIFTVFLPLK